MGAGVLHQQTFVLHTLQSGRLRLGDCKVVTDAQLQPNGGRTGSNLTVNVPVAIE